MESAYYALASTTRLDNGFSFRIIKPTDNEINHELLNGTIIHDGVYSDIPTSLASDNSLYWQPCVMLFKDYIPVGFMVFTLKWENHFTDEYEDSEHLIFELSYVFLKPELRGNSYFSDFTTKLINELLEEVHCSLAQTDAENVAMTFYAEYASKEGRYIGGIVSELMSDFCDDREFVFNEVIN